MSDMQRSSARDTALEVLMQVSRANAWSDGSLKRTIAKTSWTAGRRRSARVLPTVSSKTAVCWTTISAAGAARSLTGWSQ